MSLHSGRSLRVGVVGSGQWARSFVGPGVLRAADTELSGVWGRNVARAAACANSLECFAFPDIDELLAVSDAVAIAVDPRAQPVLAARAVAQGKHVLLEKPIAVTAGEALTLQSQITEAGVTSVVSLIYRWLPAYRRLTSMGLVPAGTQLRVRWRSNHYTTTQDSFRSDLGALFDVGPHIADLLWPLTGDIREVTGSHTRTMVNALLRHTGGRSTVLDIDCAADVVERQVSITAVGEDGHERMLLGGGELARPTHLAVTVLGDFACAVRGQVCSVPTVRDGLRVARIVDQINHGLGHRVP